MTDKISESLGMVPYDEENNYEIIEPEIPENHDELEDYHFARDNIRAVIQNGNDAIDRMMDIAQQSQHPRAYEVIATLMKATLDANKDLIELDKKRLERTGMKPGETGADNPDNNNNNKSLFVGTTKDLQKMLASMKEDD